MALYVIRHKVSGAYLKGTQSVADDPDDARKFSTEGDARAFMAACHPRAESFAEVVAVPASHLDPLTGQYAGAPDPAPAPDHHDQAVS